MADSFFGFGAVKSRNRRAPQVILTEIIAPGRFDYFWLLDANGTIWYYWLDLSGVLENSGTKPTSTTGGRSM